MHKNRTTSQKTVTFLLLFVLSLGFFTNKALAQGDKEQMAKDLVENGQYTEALPYFEDLVNLYPADKELNYLLGMCLSETEQFSAKTKKALLNSLGDDTPKKSLYYLATCFHAENNFSEALNYYQQFDEQAKNKIKKSTELEKRMALCQQQINPFQKLAVQAEMKPAEEQTKIIADSKITITEISAPAIIAPEESQNINIPEELEDSLINFQVNSNIKYLKFNQFKNEQSLHAFVGAWKAEQELKMVLEKTRRLREEYNIAFAEGKDEIANEILLLEKETYTKNQEIAQGYTEARTYENKYWEQAAPSAIKNFSDQIHFLEDSIGQAKEAARKIKMEAEKPLVLQSSSVKPQAPEEIKPTDTSVIYKIQIGAYSKTPPDWVQRLFKKLSVIRRIDQYTDEKGVTVYTVGELKSYKDALQMQSQVRLEGVQDAFIAAYQNGERIPLNEAKKITER